MKKNINYRWIFQWIFIIIFIVIPTSDAKICHQVDNVTRDCSEIFKVMTKCNSDFVNHAAFSSDPFTMCTDNLAFVSYRFTMDFYNKLFTTHDPHSQNTCADGILNSNRMDLISRFIINSKTLWDSANCDACYDNLTSPVQNLSRNTIEFFSFSHSFDECVKNATNKSNNNSIVCDECGKKYQTLNSFYEQLKKSAKVCFDLEDKMNKTRKDWSEIYNCYNGKQTSLTAFYSLSSIVFVVAIGFYASVYYIGMKYPATETVASEEASEEEVSDDETEEEVFDDGFPYVIYGRSIPSNLPYQLLVDEIK